MLVNQSKLSNDPIRHSILHVRSAGVGLLTKDEPIQCLQCIQMGTGEGDDMPLALGSQRAKRLGHRHNNNSVSLLDGILTMTLGSCVNSAQAHT